VTQQFSDPRHEERAKAALDAREVEMNARLEAQLPPSFKGRLSAHYDVVAHEAHNPEMLQMWDKLEDERKDRYQNRYIVEHNLHVQDVKSDHITGSRKLNRIAPERFGEERRRGFDIIDNRTHGRLAKEKQLHEDFTTKRLNPWDRTQQGRLEASMEMVQTIRVPAAESSGGRGLASSSSAPQLRNTTMRAQGQASGAASVAASSTKRSAPASVARSRSSSAVGGGGGGGGRLPPSSHMMPGAPPPAPAIPGNAVGSVFSHARG